MTDAFSDSHRFELSQQVQMNCHIADALHAADFTLCIYLLKMREFYRWESQLAFSQKLENQTIGEWLTQREQLWESLANEQFAEIKIGKQCFDPFESTKINQALEPYQLVYSGGLGIFGKPHFFLGELHNKIEYHEYTVFIANREHARDLSAPPAMAQGKTIFIRRESLKRMLWEKLEEWRWNQPDNAMARALSFYDFDKDVNTALDAMTENELNSVLLHEIGEVKAGKLLGNHWEDMLSDLPHSKAEIMLRAVRDHIADALSTLPDLLEKEQPAALHFYFANLSNMRKHLYPALFSAYQHWHENNDLKPLKKMVRQGLEHWQILADNALNLYRIQGRQARKDIESLLENSQL